MIFKKNEEMIKANRVFRILFGSVDWVDLILLILNSGIGLAITHYLGYEINWIYSIFFIFWIMFFYLGNEFLGFYKNQDFSEKDITFRHLFTNSHQLLAVLFFSLSLIPLIQILILSFSNYLTVYIICILALWLLLKNFLERRIKIFGFTESISSFMISFITPLIALNINRIQIHEILLPIAFFSFLQIIAFKLFRVINEIFEGANKAEFTLTYIGPHTILRTIAFMIPFGYFSCLFLLFLQSNNQLFQPLLFTSPLAIYFVIKISQISEEQRENVKTSKPISLIFVFFVEVIWIIELWIKK